MSVHSAPAMRAPFAPARARGHRGREPNLVRLAHHDDFPDADARPSSSPRSLRDPEQRHPQAQEARRRSHGPLRREDQGSPDPLRRQRPHPRRKCSSRFFLRSGLRSRRGGGCPGNARRRRRARSDASIPVRARTLEMAERVDVARERVRVSPSPGTHAPGDADLRGGSSSRWASIPGHPTPRRSQPPQPPADASRHRPLPTPSVSSTPTPRRELTSVLPSPASVRPSNRFPGKRPDRQQQALMAKNKKTACAYPGGVLSAGAVLRGASPAPSSESSRSRRS